MTFILELWVEGATDATLSDSPEASMQGGALPSIVRRTLSELFDKDSAVFDRVVDSTVRVEWLKVQMRDAVAFSGGGRRNLSLWAKKLLVALEQARWRRSACLIVAIRDRDGDPIRIKERDEVNGVLRDSGQHGHATGVCIEEVEAWLLADSKAIQLCFGRGPEAGIPGNPEAVPEPKELLRSILASLDPEREARPWANVYHEVAQHVNLSRLEKLCPKGYARLRQDLFQLVIPSLR